MSKLRDQLNRGNFVIETKSGTDSWRRFSYDPDGDVMRIRFDYMKENRRAGTHVRLIGPDGAQLESTEQ